MQQFFASVVPGSERCVCDELRELGFASVRLNRGGIPFRGEWRDGPTGRQRRYYAITRRGRALLKDKALEWSAFSLAVNTLLFGSDGAAGMAIRALA